jgi:hypothetical protein
MMMKKLAVWLCSMMSLAAIQVSAQKLPAPAPAQLTRGAMAHYGNVPLGFEANQGQTDPQVNFLARGNGYSVFLTSGGMVLSLRPSEPVALPTPATTAAGSIANNVASHGKTTVTPPAPTTMIFNLVGAASNPTAVGEDPLPTKVNYFIGHDPKKWRTNVQTYAKIRYQSVYPGIDLVYYGNNRQVEYDFVVAPGADANKVQFSVKGADALSVDADGNLVLTKGTTQLHFQTPTIYQQVNGARVKVAGNYALKDSTHVGFTVAAHDNSKTLVIDPVLVYSTLLGGRSSDQADAIAVDAEGNAYVTGSSSSPDFPLAIPGGSNPNLQRIFLAKLDVSGSTLLFADYFGGTSGSDSATAIALDSSGNAYVTGTTYSTDFTILNAFQPVLAGSSDTFLTKFSADGSDVVYSTYLGGTNYEQGTSIAVDTAGQATIAGVTQSQDFPLFNAYQSTIAASQNNNWGLYGFFSRFSADGSSLVYSSYLAGNLVSSVCGYCEPYTQILGVAQDTAGNLFVTGSTNNTNFPVTSGAYMTGYIGINNNSEGFVSKFDTTGAIDYSTYFGGTNYTVSNAIAVDATGSAYITGYDPANGDGFPITSTAICDPVTQNCEGMFVTKFDPAGANLTYSTFLGPDNQSQGRAIQVDASGNAYVIGNGYSALYTPVNPIEGYIGNYDVLLAEIDATGSSQVFSTFIGAEQTDYALGMVLDATGSIYIAGYTNSTFFPVTQSAFQSSWGGQIDAFVLKVGPAAASAVTIGPSLLQFSTLTVGVASPPRSTILRNMGTAALTINTKTITGDFTETDDCGTSVAPGSFCTFTAIFTPTAPGSRFGTILLGDNASGSPHLINMVGDGSSPVVTLSALSLTFTSLPVGQTSAPQTITVSNTGNATLNISSIAVTGSFASTNTCPSALAFGSSCEIQVTVTPIVGGALTGTLTLTDDAPDSPQIIPLSGSGYVTTGTVTPAALTFPSTALGSTSVAQIVTVKNTGTVAMTVTGVTLTGAFAQTNTCTSVPAGGTCTVSITSVPTVAGAQTGILTLNDNAQGNPQAVALTGMGIAGIASITPGSLTFAAATVGTASAAQTVTVTNTGNGPLTISGAVATGDFAISNNTCTSVAANATCTLQVKFTATTSGARTGTVTFTDSAENTPQVMNVNGSGIDFSVSSTGGSATVKAGATATYAITINPVGGSFSTAIALTCNGIPAFATCTVSPTSVTPGSTAPSVTVTVKTAGTTAELRNPVKTQGPMLAFWSMAQSMGIFGMLLLGGKRRSKKAKWLALAAVLMLSMLFVAGCGGGTSHTTTTTTASSATPAGTYHMVVIGTSAGMEHFVDLTLTVQ